MKTYDVLARVFAREGVSTCFALMGDANMNFATRLGQGGCRMIYVRHEHCAVAASMAYARKTGQVGVSTVTCGPGLTQLMTALPAAVRAGIPLVVFAGEAPLGKAWYNQMIDQAPFVTATGGIYRSLHHVTGMPNAIRDAFAEARRLCKPVVLGVPFDLQDQVWTGTDELPIPSGDLWPQIAPMAPHQDDIARAVDLIGRAKRIVVMAGLGAAQANAAQECRTLAERCDALLATTLPARGLFAGDPFNLSIAGGFSTDVARACFAQADLVIAVGTSLASHNADAGKLWPKAQVLQIDTNPIAVSQGRVAASAHVRADARLGTLALAEAVPPRAADWRSPALAQDIATRPADDTTFSIPSGRLDPRDVVAVLESHLPQDWQLVNSSGHCSYYFAQMPSRHFEKFLTIREFGAIGNGISFAMGVAAACPDDTIVLFDGDGSILMHVQELETIRRHGLNILIIVLNDQAYGSEIHKLRADGLPDDGAVFGPTDLAAIARGFGIAGESVTDLDAIPALIEGFARSDGAALWDIQISDQVYSPVIARVHPPGKHK